MKAKRRYRAKCIHFDEAHFSCKLVRGRLVKRGGVRVIQLSCECTMRGDCGYEEKEDAGGGK